MRVAARAVITAALMRAMAVVLALSPVVFTALPAGATVFHAKDEALELAFPESDRVEARTFILTDAQKNEVEKLARAPLESQLWTVHVGWRGAEILGYAVIDSRIMRTLPATYMVVLTPGGEVSRVEVLAFHEPPEYLPTARWTRQFTGRTLDEDLALRSGIQGITGATLSATALTAGVRRILALRAVLAAELPLPGK